jgi:hypothetical protein
VTVACEHTWLGELALSPVVVEPFRQSWDNYAPAAGVHVCGHPGVCWLPRSSFLRVLASAPWRACPCRCESCCGGDCRVAWLGNVRIGPAQ